MQPTTGETAAAVPAEEYAAMPSITISHGVLQKVPANLKALEVIGVWWSDWGNPTRTCQTLERIGRLHELTHTLARRGYDPEESSGRWGKHP